MAKVNKIIAVYPGRFQPFHMGHYEVYKGLVKLFGKNNVYLSTSDKQYPSDRYPFSFEEKQQIITKLFDIQKNNIILTTQPYYPGELFAEIDYDTTAVVFVTGEKDRNRVERDRYETLKRNTVVKPFKEKMYSLTVPLKSKGQSASFIREYFDNTDDTENLKKFFVNLYGKFDEDIFKMFLENLKP